MTRFISITLSTLLLSACAVGPDYQRPDVPTQDAFIGETARSLENASSTVGLSPDAAWWQSLKDPILVDLVEAAVTGNYDIVIAQSRVREARALRHVSASRFYPQVGVGGTAQNYRQSENGVGAGPALARQGLADPTGDIYQMGFDAVWELDVFGGTRRSVEAADAQVEGVIESRRAVLISVIAEVARNYVELRGAQRRLVITEKNVGIQTETLTLVANKHATGLVPEIDVVRAQAQFEITSARIPPLRATIRAAAYRIAVLTGDQPGALLSTLLLSHPIPLAPDLVPVGLPSDLLLRRPDVRQAERQLAATSAGIGVATGDLYPKFFLTGAAGLESGSFSSLFESASRVFSIGPTVQWPLLQGGRLRAQVDAAQARQDKAYAGFQQVVLLALEDVETSLVRYAEKQIEHKRFEAAATASARSAELARILYDKGLDDFLTVLDAERVLAETEDQQIVSETAVAVRLIAIYKALGGGWKVYERGYSIEHGKDA